MVARMILYGMMELEPFTLELPGSTLAKLRELARQAGDDWTAEALAAYVLLDVAEAEPI